MRRGIKHNAIEMAKAANTLHHKAEISAEELGLFRGRETQRANHVGVLLGKVEGPFGPNSAPLSHNLRRCRAGPKVSMVRRESGTLFALRSQVFKQTRTDDTQKPPKRSRGKRGCQEILKIFFLIVEVKKTCYGRRRTHLAPLNV